MDDLVKDMTAEPYTDSPIAHTEEEMKWLPGAREDFSAELEYVFSSINIY